jgi:hypothetical protein
MKLLFESWRKFLNESDISHSGILKMSLPQDALSAVEAVQTMLPEEAIRLSSKDLHITLIHQDILKPFSSQIKDIDFPSPPPVIIEDGVWERDSMGKKSWALRLENQEDYKDYVKQVMELLGSPNTSPEPERVFHISVANLTGNPHDSVR